MKIHKTKFVLVLCIVGISVLAIKTYHRVSACDGGGDCEYLNCEWPDTSFCTCKVDSPSGCRGDNTCQCWNCGDQRCSSCGDDGCCKTKSVCEGPPGSCPVDACPAGYANLGDSDSCRGSCRSGEGVIQWGSNKCGCEGCGNSTVYHRYCQKPVTNPPTIVVDLPPTCPQDYTFTVTATDSDGASTIDYFHLKFVDSAGASYEFVVDISGSSAWVNAPTVINPLSAGVVACDGSGNTACTSGNSVTVKVQVTGFTGLPGWNNTVQAKAWDTASGESEWSNGGTFVSGMTPVASISNGGTSGSNITLNLGITNNKPGSSTCTLTCTGTGCSCPSISCPAGNPASGSSVCSVGGTGSYSFTFTAANACGNNSAVLTQNVGAPWLMTAFGDSFASTGYSSMVLKNVTSFTDLVPQTAKGNPPGTGNAAWFSTYIISSGNPTLTSGQDSLRFYLMKNYYDQNIDLFGGTLLYDTLLAMVTSNGVTPETVGTSISGSCTGRHVYFNSSGLTFTGNYTDGSPNDACIFVIRGPITVNATVTRIDGFLIADGGTFSTLNTNTTLVVKGGVFANTTSFARALDAFENESNPSELIVYDPKYLDLLRDILGQSYPTRVREYQYSAPPE